MGEDLDDLEYGDNIFFPPLVVLDLKLGFTLTRQSLYHLSYASRPGNDFLNTVSKTQPVQEKNNS
jgi:hypothetical protein